MRERAGLWYWLIVGLIVFGFIHWYQHRSIEHPPGVLAPDDPEQTALDNDSAFDIDGGRYHIHPLAKFRITARVLSREDYRLDNMAGLVPTDLALGWGPMSDSDVLKDIDISQSGRFYFWYTQNFPIPRREIEIHSANMHLIPADSSVRRELRRVRTGSIVHFDGELVEVAGKDGWTMRSSLTREDTGNGACELVWVEHLDLR
jgi:hypothetical protein